MHEDFSLIKSLEDLSLTKIIPLVAGLVMLGSVLLPWLSSPFFDSGSSLSVAEASRDLHWYALLGGGLVLLGSFFKDPKTQGIAHLGLGLIAILTIVAAEAPIFMVPPGVEASSTEILKEIAGVIHIGFYLYFLASLVVVVSGVNSLSLAKKGGGLQASS